MKATAAGLAAVCVVGAGAGLYLRPDLQAAGTPARAAPAPLVRVNTAEAGPSSIPDEAARLQNQLQMLVLGGVEPAAPAPAPGSAATANTGLTPGRAPLVEVSASQPAPSSGPARTQAAPTAPTTRAPQPVPTARSAQPRTPSAETRSAAAPAAARPFVLASQTPAPVILPPPSRTVALQPARVAAPVRAAPPVAESRPATAQAEPARKPEGPSYDCSRARSAAERMICASPELADLDRNMAAELEAAVAAGHSPRELARDQASWRKRRDVAAPDPRAVADIYRQRIGQLRSMQ